MTAPATRISFDAFAAGEIPIVIIGLGYVGLPLAALFAKRFRIIGLDINARRVAELESNFDRTRELTAEQIAAVRWKSGPAGLSFTTDPAVMADARLIIVTVPTPIDEHKTPDLTPLIKSSRMIGRHIRAGTTVVYESTVYPGCTEEQCLPLIEAESGLKWRESFHAGYSPERVNPGDKEHTVERIKKVVAGDDAVTAELLREVYGAVITAGVFVAASIKTAEAAKVIENTQRDLNIALMNELALIFDRLGVDTRDVLAAASTKWNFLPFHPGLVGGHCIGVDPYYLTFKAESVGYHPQVILAGRRINDGMGKFIAEKAVKLMIAHGRTIRGARVLILGWTFKENVPDVRNTRVIDIQRELRSYGLEVDCHDPEASAEEVLHEYGVKLVERVAPEGPYDAVILAVKHTAFFGHFAAPALRRLGGATPPVVVDVKGLISPALAAAENLPYWRL